MLKFDEINPQNIPNIKQRIKAYDEIILNHLAQKNRERMVTGDVRGASLDSNLQKIIANGEIFCPFIKQHLDGKITIARWALAICMALTLLFKGFWAIWLVLIALYFLGVEREKNISLEYDRKKLAKAYQQNN